MRASTPLLGKSKALIQTAKGLDAKARADYEVAARSAQGLVEGRGSGPVPIAYGLHDAQIVDVNPEWASVVVNAGRSQGVREGMPFLVLREDTVIGRIKVVMTRENVSAALIEQTDKPKQQTPFKVGDRLKVDAK